MEILSNLTPLLITLKVAFFATLISFVFGVGFAFLTSKYNFRGRDTLDAILTLPLVMPPTVLGYYLIVLWGRNGFLGHFLLENFGISLIFNIKGAILAASVVSFPLLYKTARASFEAVSDNFINAARILGDNEFNVFIRIIIPLAKRGLLAGVMLAFVRAMGDFGTTLMVAGNIPGKTQTAALAVFDAVQAGNYNLANTIVLILSIMSFAFLVMSNKLVKNIY